MVTAISTSGAGLFDRQAGDADVHSTALRSWVDSRFAARAVVAAMAVPSVRSSALVSTERPRNLLFAGMSEPS